MTIQCPHCSETIEVPSEIAEGQHILCPYCGLKFTFEHSNSDRLMFGVIERFKHCIQGVRLSIKKMHGIKSGIKKPFLVKISAAVVLFILFSKAVSSCFSVGGDGWEAETVTRENGDDEVKIYIAGSKAKLYTDSIKKYGLLIVVDSDDQEVRFYWPLAEETEKSNDGKVHYFIYSTIGNIWCEKSWDNLKEKMFEMLKRKTAEEILDYIDGLR